MRECLDVVLSKHRPAVLGAALFVTMAIADLIVRRVRNDDALYDVRKLNKNASNGELGWLFGVMFLVGTVFSAVLAQRVSKAADRCKDLWGERSATADGRTGLIQDEHTPRNSTLDSYGAV
jgi:hypothetical protein